MSRLVGLGGYAGAGKDAIASALEARGWVNHGSFSIELNECLLVLNPIIMAEGFTAFGQGGGVIEHRYADVFRYMDGYAGYAQFKEIPEVRRLLQAMGTEVGRNRLGEDIWVDAKRRAITPDLEAGRDVVLTAVRFTNELEMVRSLGGLTVWVERPGYGPVNEHISDNALAWQDFDMVVHNDSTLEDLIDRVSIVEDAAAVWCR